MLKKALIASAVLASFVGGAQAQSANWGVTGTITPATCTIALGSGSTNVDYGALANATVRTYPVYVNTYELGTKSLAISVNCTASMPVQLAFADNHAAQLFAIGDGYDAIRFGVADGTKTVPFGTYDLTVSNVLVDGVAPAGHLSAPTGTTAWSSTTAAGAPAFFAAPGYASAFTKTAGATTPSTLTTLGGTLSFNTRVSKAYVDSSAATITITGSGTVTLQYL